MKHTRTFRTLALVGVAAFALTACGSGAGEAEGGATGGATGGASEPTAGGTDGGDAVGTEVEGGELLSALQEQGYINVGIANEVPYGFQNDEGDVTGEAPEVARRVLEELGIDEVRADVVEFGALISGLQAGQFDMIAAGMYINEERAQQILFSDPDYCVGEAFAVPEGNPDNLSDFQSVIDSGATIAILSGAVEEGYAATAGVPDDQIELFTDVNAQYEALANGRVDAVTGTYLTVKTQVDSREGLAVTESFFPVDENGEEILGCGGFGFRQDNEEFCMAFNDALNSLQEEGEVLPIITEFGFAEEDVQRAQDLTVADLTGDTANACGGDGGGSGGGDTESTETESTEEG